MSSPGVASGSPPSVVFWFAIVFLDPRRWLGALFALVGVAVSIVAALLPSSLMQRISSPPPSVPLRRRPTRTPPSRRTLYRRPFPSPIQPSITSASPRSRRRPHTAGDVPLVTRVTFTHEPPLRSSSTGSILASSASNSSSDPIPTSSLAQPESGLEPSPAALPDSAPPQTLFTPLSLPSPVTDPHRIFPFNNSSSLQSLDCLDLATPMEISSSPLHRELSQSSKRPFRLPIPTLGFGKRRSTSNIKVASEVARESEQLKDTLAPEGDKRRPSMPRSTTISNPSAPTHELCPSAPLPRRRFSLFSREGNAKKELILCPLSSAPDTVPAVPPLPARFLERTISSNAVAGPSALPSSAATTISFSPLVPTQTPPPRPARTDPYKTHGVPVPGSERARAFLRAEREMRERRILSASDGRGAKGKEAPQAAAAAEVTVEAVDEFGVVATPTVPGPTAPGPTRRRSWGLARCGHDSPRTQPELELRKLEKRRKDTSKLHESLGAVRESRQAVGAKERGYVSDTGA